MNESNEANDEDGASAPMMMNLPQNLGNMGEDDISLPLSLIKGLRRKSLDPSIASANAMDSSTSSNNTSDKDDSGGDEEGGSNTSSTSKRAEMAGTLSVGQISSLSGSEQEGNSRGRVGILRVGGNNAGFSTSSSDENITGDDELSEKVVVRGKSVTSNSQPQEPQVQYKVSFAEGHCSKKAKAGNSSDDGEEAAAASPKRKRNQEKSKSSSADEKKTGKRPRNAGPENLKDGSIAFQVSDSSGTEGRDNNNGQRNGGAPSRAVSSSSSATGSSHQDPGQASSDSLLYKTDESPEQEKDDVDKSSGSPQLTSKNDPSKFTIAKSPSSPSKEHIYQDSEERRLERNQREKERSNKIATQVDTLRCLLQRGGLFIPKKTKSSVLSEASNYIKTMQDRQQVMNAELENLQRQYVTAVAALSQQQTQAAAKQAHAQDAIGGDMSHDYQLIFKSTMAGMCVATMGGTFLDCNAAFEKETGISQSQLINMTIFNVIHANDLQKALNMISRMIDIGYPEGNNGNNQGVASQQASQGPEEPLLLQSSIPNRPDLGLCVTLVRGPDAMPKCFSVTLVKNASTGGASNGSPSPYNPALPSIPSTPMQFVPTAARAMPQEIPQQQPNALAPAMVTIDATVAPGAASIQGPATGSFLQGANSSQVSAMSGYSVEQPANSQASLLASQPASNVPAPQLLQLLLLQQMQQGQGQGQQQQQPAVAQGQQQFHQFQPAIHQQQQQQQLPNQLPTTGIMQNAHLASGQAHPGHWNAENLAMLPQIQQILKPNASPQGSDGDGKDANGQGLIQNQPSAAPVPQLPAYLNAPNLPMLPQIQQILKPPESNAPSQGSKKSGGDERDDSRPWYYAG